MVYVVSLVAVIALLPVALFVAIALFAWRIPEPAPRGSRSRRVIAIIPAHNEESVIEGILADLADQDYPSDHLEVHVVADRCTDSTAERAGRLAVVHDRASGEETKGAAIGWLVGRMTIGSSDIVVIFDADARVGSDVIAALSDGADSGFRAMQVYLDTPNPDESYVALAGALSQWMSNRLIDLPRRNLGMSCSLLGTGFALVGDLTRKLEDTGLGMTEDQALSDRFAIEGEQVIWLHHVHVLDEKPATIDVLTRQRARWAQGRALGRRRSLRALLFDDGSWSLSRLDRIVRLILPGRTISATILAGIAAAAFMWPSVLVFSPFVIIGLLTIAVSLSVAALLAEGAGTAQVAKIPIIGLFALLWIPERILARRDRSWYHTPHEGAGGG